VILTVAALLTDLEPSIRLKGRDQFLDLCGHDAKIVPAPACSTCLGDGVLTQRPALRLPERTAPVRSEVLCLLSRDGKLVEALVGHGLDASPCP
jgi:hypothetical protein